MPNKNLVTDFGAVGDGQRATTNATIASGTATLAVSTGIFAAGDVTKAIAIWQGDTRLIFTTILSFTNSTHIVLSSNIGTTLSGTSVDILWGTDNTNAFLGVSGWRAYAQGQTNPADPPVLQIPDGNYAFQSNASSGQSIHFGVLNAAKMTGLSGVAANCKLMQFDSSEMSFGADPPIVPNRGLQNSGGNSVRLLTSASGASSVFLSDPHGLDLGGNSYGSRVVVGRSCLIAAFDMQGHNGSDFGYPPNSFFYEWNTITAYNTTTGEVSLQTATTQQYKSTYPSWGLLNTIFGSDQGGPSTMWIAPDDYGYMVTLENFTIDSPHNQSAARKRYIVLNNLVMSGPGLYPTQNDTFTATSCTYPQLLEVDKMVNQVTWNSCTLLRLQQQSASPNHMILNGGSIGTLETAKYTEANNVAFTGAAKIQVGVAAFGRTDRVVLTNCTGIAEIVRGGADTADEGTASTFYAFSSGVVRFLKTENDGIGRENPTRCFVPGTWVTLDDKYMDQVADVYEDGTYCYISWLHLTSWPFTPVLLLKDHPCPDFTMSGCTGTAPELEDWNQATPRIPLYSYSKRTYTADGTGTTVKARPFLLGRLTTAKFTVSTPGSVTYHESQFDNWPTVKSDYSSYTFGPTIACINSGLRTVNGGAAATGSQGSDSIPDLTSIGQIWFPGESFSGPVFSANGSGAVITVEFTMDQGISSSSSSATPVASFPVSHGGGKRHVKMVGY